MEWVLVIMLWVSPPVPEEDAAITHFRTGFETYQECFEAAKKVVDTVKLLPDAAQRANIMCRPK